jgi:hypothetical protein
MIKNILLIFTSIISLLFILELSLRLYNPNIESYNNIIKRYNIRYNNYRYSINGKESMYCNIYSENDFSTFRLKDMFHATVLDKESNALFTMDTNAEGFRHLENLAPLMDSAKNKARMMVFGDSVTFGYGVEQINCYPEKINLLFKNKGIVVNLGTPGWGFAEYFLAYQKYCQMVNPQLVILGIFPANDFEDLQCSNWNGKSKGFLPKKIYRTDYFFDSSGNFSKHDIRYDYFFLRNIYLWILSSARIQSIYNNYHDDIQTSVNIASKLIKEITKKQSTLLLLIPSENMCKESQEDSRIVKLKGLIKNESNLNILDFIPIFKEKGQYTHFYVDGSHLNEEGNLFVATYILDFIEKHNLLK